MKQENNRDILVVSNEEFIALYMTQSGQEEVEIEELDRAYYSVVNYLQDRENIHVGYNPGEKNIKFYSHLKLLECRSGIVMLANKVELADLKVAIIAPISRRTKHVFRDAIDNFFMEELKNNSDI